MVSSTDVISAWQNRMIISGYSHYTIYNYLLIVRRFLNQFPKPTLFDIEAWLAASRQSYTLPTLKVYSEALRSYFSFCFDHGLSDQNLASRIPIPRIPFKRRTAPHPDEVVKLLRLRLPNRTKVLLYLLIDTGLRIGEATSILLADIDLSRLSISVTGKGGDQRQVYISLSTADAIQLYLLTRRYNSVYLFPGQRAATWSHNAINHHIGKLCRKAGIPHYSAHQFRHFFATSTINAGANIRAISEILGHKDPGITLKIYVHNDEDLKRTQHSIYSPLEALVKGVK